MRRAKRPQAEVAITPVPGVRPARFVVGFAILAALAFGALRAPFSRPAADRFSVGLAQVSAALIHVAGGHVLVEGAVIRSPFNGFATEMKDGGNGVNVTLLLWSAMLAFPASWTWKAKGLLAGSMALQAVNLIRFISLFYLGQYSRKWFELAHAYLWESLIMLDALVVFWMWVRMMHHPTAGPDAAG